MSAPDIERLREILAAHAGRFVLAVTGAGISAASGIATFRGSEPDAIWRRDPQELATRAYFELDPVSHWRWYLSRFAALDTARPNPAHEALAAYERRQARHGRFLLVTQNIDTLHEQAGSEKMIKVHGSADRVRCSRPGCRHAAPSGSLPRSAIDLDGFGADPSAATLPRCPECDGALRPHVLFFDEYYGEHRDYGFDRVETASWEADLVLFVGTSMSVGVTDLLFRAGRATGATMALLDPEPQVGIYAGGLEIVRAAAEVALPAAVAG